MANQVIIRALKRELEIAKQALLDAFVAVGGMAEERDDSGYQTRQARNVTERPRDYVAHAINTLTFAAANYDVVKEQLELAEKAVRNA